MLRFSASEHRSDAFQTVLANACQRVKLTENLPRPFENILAYRNGSAQIVEWSCWQVWLQYLTFVHRLNTGPGSRVEVSKANLKRAARTTRPAAS